MLVLKLDMMLKHMFKNKIFLFGFSTRYLLTKYFNDGTISESYHKKFITAVFAFYRQSSRYIFKKCIVTMIHFGNMHNGLIILKYSDVECFIKWCANSWQFDNYEIEHLYEQFVEFKFLRDANLPTDTLKDVILSE